MGPSGIGVLYAKKQHLDAMPPYEGGGEMIETVSVDKVTYAAPPHRFEAGTPPIVEAIGLGAALNYMMQIGRDNIARHEAELARVRARAYVGIRLADDSRHGAGQGCDRVVFHRRAASRTTSRPSSTARASRFAPDITARSR